MGNVNIDFLSDRITEKDIPIWRGEREGEVFVFVDWKPISENRYHSRRPTDYRILHNYAVSLTPRAERSIFRVITIIIAEK